MESFFSLLERRIREVDSILCVGLDPHPEDLPAVTAESMGNYCTHLIESTHDVAAAYKPNAAFFEALGPAGWAVLKEVIEAVPDGIPVILDAKRGDIASTARAYARSAFESLGVDAITINPYLGYDTLEPFLENPAKGVFLLCKTSNPGSADLQNIQVRNPTDTSGSWQVSNLYEHVAELASTWNQNDNLGLVVGATHPAALARVRKVAPELWILAPGVGAQGGDLRTALQAGLRRDGMGLLVPVSRGISRTEDPRRAAEDLVTLMRDEVQTVKGTWAEVEGSPFETLEGGALADELLAAGCVQFGEFTLKSGLVSPIYIDLRRLVAYPELLARVATAYLPLLRELKFKHLGALPYAALPIASAISLQTGLPMLYPRKEVKTYGTKAPIEGLFSPGERVVVIDDLTTTGGSKFEAIEVLTRAGLQVKDVVVLIDRQSGAAKSLAQAGYQLHTVFTLTELLDHWERKERVPPEQIAAVRIFLSETQDS